MGEEEEEADVTREEGGGGVEGGGNRNSTKHQGGGQGSEEAREVCTGEVDRTSESVPSRALIGGSSPVSSTQQRCRMTSGRWMLGAGGRGGSHVSREGSPFEQYRSEEGKRGGGEAVEWKETGEVEVGDSGGWRLEVIYYIRAYMVYVVYVVYIYMVNGADTVYCIVDNAIWYIYGMYSAYCTYQVYIASKIRRNCIYLVYLGIITLSALIKVFILAVLNTQPSPPPPGQPTTTTTPQQLLAAAAQHHSTSYCTPAQADGALQSPLYQSPFGLGAVQGNVGRGGLAGCEEKMVHRHHLRPARVWGWGWSARS